MNGPGQPLSLAPLFARACPSFLCDVIVTSLGGEGFTAGAVKITSVGWAYHERPGPDGLEGTVGTRLEHFTGV